MVDLPTTGVYHASEISVSSAERTSSLLQQNWNSYHMFLNLKGFHNHLVHYMLTAYALGADPDELQDAFEVNAKLQRPALPLNEGVVGKLYSDRYFKSLLGYELYFPDYKAFFLEKSNQDGWQNVVNNYLFSRNEIAEDLLVRLHAGVIHPLLHFGFGIEFQQPTVICEALAQAVSHNNFFGPFLFTSERLARDQIHEKGASLIDLVREIRKDPSLYDSDYWDGGDSLNDKIVSEAPNKLCEIAAKWKVNVDDIDEKTAEMTNVAAFMTGAAQRPDKEVKLDFFFIHCVNASIFFSSINAQHWIRAEDKARLLEWKGRTDLLTYASRLAPELHPEEITNYKPQQDGMTWPLLIQRANQLKHDDGHVPKLIRALAHGEQICAPYETQQGVSSKFPLKQKEWLQIANMALDTTTTPVLLNKWVRGAGGAHNWEKFANRS